MCDLWGHFLAKICYFLMDDLNQKSMEAFTYAICLELQENLHIHTPTAIRGDTEFDQVARSFNNIPRTLQGVLRMTSSTIVNTLLDIEPLFIMLRNISKDFRIRYIGGNECNAGIRVESDGDFVAPRNDRYLYGCDSRDIPIRAAGLESFWNGLSYPTDNIGAIYRTSCLVYSSTRELYASKRAWKYMLRGFSAHKIELSAGEDKVLGRVSLLSKFSTQTAGYPCQ